MSDSSAEVAQILQSHLDNQQEETEQDAREEDGRDDDDDDGDEDTLPVVMDAMPLSPGEENEAMQVMDEEAGVMIVDDSTEDGIQGREVVVIGPKQTQNK